MGIFLSCVTGRGKYMMFWSEFANSRTVGDSQFPEDQKTLEPVDDVFGGRVGEFRPFKWL